MANFKIPKQLYEIIKNSFDFHYCFELQYDEANNKGVMYFNFFDSALDLFVKCCNFRKEQGLLEMIFCEDEFRVLHRAGITDNVIATTYDPKFNQNNTSTTDWYDGLEILTIELTFEVDDTETFQYGDLAITDDQNQTKLFSFDW